MDDDEAVRRALGRLLRAWACEPLLASAESCLAAALDPPPACLVLDVSLPGRSGFDLQEQLEGTGAAPPTIMMIGARDAHLRERAERQGCRAFFWKSVDSPGAPYRDCGDRGRRRAARVGGAQNAAACLPPPPSRADSTAEGPSAHACGVTVRRA